MRHWRNFGVVLIAGLALPLALVPYDQANARPRILVGYAHYAVNGGNALELLRQMELHGPQVNGTEAYATTEGSLVHSGTVVGGKTCQIPDYQLTARFTITLPAAQDLAGAGKSVRRAWSAFYQFAKRHEERHRAIWVDCLTAMERTVRALRAPDCAVLESRIARILQQGSRTCDRRHASFDRADRAQLARQPLIRQALRATGKL